VGGEEAAAVLRVVGQPPQFSFPVKDHLALGEALDLIDFETAAEVRCDPGWKMKCHMPFPEKEKVPATHGHCSGTDVVRQAERS
jgi:hypothetical protein